MRLPWRAKLVITVAVCCGGASVATIAGVTRPEGFGSLWLLFALTALVLASWLWPIVMYSDSSSQAHHLDEGFFLVLALVLPPLGVLAAFVLAAITSIVVRRRSFIKSLFNLGQILAAVGAGLLTLHELAPPTGPLSAVTMIAAVAGALVYFLMNSLFVAAILAATGADDFRASLLDGIEIRSLLLAASVSLGLVSALAITAYPYAAPLTAIPFWAFRQTLAGHFRARHDRSRLLGLFHATLDIHRTMGAAEVTAALAQGASSLLRCPDAAIAEHAPDEGAMAARMSVQGDDRWLVVSGRSRTEPFDEADRMLLDAVAAVGAGAMANAALYEEGLSQRERLAAITSSVGEGIFAVDVEGRPTFLNPAGEALLGWRERELVDTSDRRTPVSALPVLEFLADPALRAMETNRTVRCELATFTRRDGTEFPVAYTCSPIIVGERSTGAVVTFRDITERVAFEEQLSYHAFHDALTGLPNRRLFLDRLQHALKRAGRSGELHAVLFADVDRFKVANDSLGHQAGDELLVTIARRLRALVREGDTLARFGGDEFTLLLEDVGGADNAEKVADAILNAVHEPIVLGCGREVVASVSVGIAFATAGSTADDVLHDADVAMYQAKRRGTGRSVTFDASAMSRRSAESVDLEASLRVGIERGELRVHYQPLYSTDTGAIVGAEALVRWEHPTRGLLGPAEFISMAEETGLILPIGSFVLGHACEQARRWRDEFGTTRTVSVNLSARQFQQHNLVQLIRAALTESGLDPALLCLEITETLAMQDIDRTIATLSELKLLGVHLAIDDFGTGYSSLNYLKRFPVDVVKLDRTFVQDLDTSTVDTAIVTAVVDLARAIGMTTVAEGVETADQLERLTAMGCPVVQGYYFSMPVADLELLTMLRSGDADVLADLSATVAGV